MTDAPTTTTTRPAAKVAVVYYSSTGVTHRLAELIAGGAADAGAEVRLRRVHETAPAEAVASNDKWQAHAEAEDVAEVSVDDILWADAVVFGTPTRYGNVSAQLKSFIDTLGPQWGAGLLADKVYSGFTASSTAHGGQESTLLALYNTVHHFGGIIVSPGYTNPLKFADGNPYGTSAAGDTVSDEVAAAAAYQGRRVATVTAALVAGRTA